MTDIRAAVAKDAQQEQQGVRIVDEISREPLWSKASLILLGICSVSYFAATVIISSRSMLWMDEVMAAWLARLHSAQLISLALMRGVMSSPPTYFVLLSAIGTVFGDSNLTFRFPSILAVYVIGLTAFFLMRRHQYSVPVSSMAMVLCLETGLFPFSTQIREYALVTACFALATFTWDTMSVRKPRLWKAALIAALLSFGVSLHFYAILLVAVFGLMELLWSADHRSIRPSVWGAVVVAGLSLFVWHPLMVRLVQITATEGSSSDYFAKPTVRRLLSSYGDLALGGKGTSLFIFLMILLASLFLVSRIFGPLNIAASSEHNPEEDNSNLDIIILSCLAIPVLTFIFAIVVTQTFNTRYVIVGVLGFALLFAKLISYFRHAPVVISSLLVASSILLLMAPSHSVSLNEKYSLDKLEQTAQLPIVVGEGLAFLELEEGASAPLRSRLVYLSTPAGVISPDPTNNILVTSWGQTRPELKVVKPATFLALTNHFYVLHTDESTDVVTQWLIAQGFSLKAQWHQRTVWLFEASRPSVGEPPNVPRINRQTATLARVGE